LQRVQQHLVESAAKSQAALNDGGSIDWTAVTNKVRGQNTNTTSLDIRQYQHSQISNHIPSTYYFSGNKHPQ
jgi:hypothetical protein